MANISLYHFSISMVLLALTGCIAIPVPSVPPSISEVPPVAGPSCNFTIVRKKQLTRSSPTHYIKLDGTTIASLEVDEYTTFPVSEGRHSLTITWHIWDADKDDVKVGTAPGSGVIVMLVKWRPLSKSIIVDCHASLNYYFTITSVNFVEIKQVDHLEGDFTIEKNKYIAPGK